MVLGCSGMVSAGRDQSSGGPADSPGNLGVGQHALHIHHRPRLHLHAVLHEVCQLLLLRPPPGNNDPPRVPVHAGDE